MSRNTDRLHQLFADLEGAQSLALVPAADRLWTW